MWSSPDPDEWARRHGADPDQGRDRRFRSGSARRSCSPTSARRSIRSPTRRPTTRTALHVLNSKRPDAPDVLYVIPIYCAGRDRYPGDAQGRRAAACTSKRPWWSSGAGERLGVVCWRKSAHSSADLPPNDVAPYVTLWGYDPMFKTHRSLPGQPTPACFPLHTATGSATAHRRDVGARRRRRAQRRLRLDARALVLRHPGGGDQRQGADRLHAVHPIRLRALPDRTRSPARICPRWWSPTTRSSRRTGRSP